MVEKHQMGSTGPRYFVPPNHDPIAENIDEGLWTWSAVFGAKLQRDMTEDGLSGVASHWLFDDYWPGSTETSLWKNVICFPHRGCQLPRRRRRSSSSPPSSGSAARALSEYKERQHAGAVARGLVAVSATSSQLRARLDALDPGHCRQRIARRSCASRNDLCREEVARGRSQAPFYYRAAHRAARPSRAGPSWCALLAEHGVQVLQLGERVEVGGHGDAAGVGGRPPGPALSAVRQRGDGAPALPGAPLHPGRRDHPPLRHHELVPAPALWRRVPRDQDRSTALEAALTELPGEWPALPPQRCPPMAWAPWPGLPATNASHRVAWAAMERGLEVYRRQTAAESRAAPLPPGSFVVSGLRRRAEGPGREAASRAGGL